MGLVYLPTNLSYKSTIHVGKYTVRPMDPMGLVSPVSSLKRIFVLKESNVGGLDSSSTFEKFFTSQLFYSQTAHKILPLLCGDFSPFILLQGGEKILFFGW